MILMVRNEEERTFIYKINDRNRRGPLRHEFRIVQSVFDKQLRQTEHANRRTMADDIETRLTSNPSDFLEKMSKILVLVVKKTIPMHFYDENGHIVTDENRVFEK